MKISVLCSLTLLLASQSFAQLVITSEGPTSLASTIQSSATDQATLDAIGSKAPSVILGGLTFNLIANPASFSLASTTTADVSYVGKDSVDTNYFGISSGGTSTLLYAPYSSASKAIGFDFSSAVSTSYSFYHIDTSFGGSTIMQTDASHFLIYEATSGSKVYDLLAVDDRGSMLVDYNDGQFLLERSFAPVPEPSTYGVIGAGALLALAAYRRRKAAKV